MADLALPDQAKSLHERYRRGFVARSRATRDLGALDSIIADTERLLGAPGATGALREQTEARLKLYRDERAAIAQIQAGGPDALAAWRLAEWSEVNFQRYGREFGGKSRATRDLGLIGELSANQASIASEATALAARLNEPKFTTQLEQINANAKLYANEAREIAAARKRVAPADLVGTLATCANRQFALYKQHFQGRSRATRRPVLLQRIIGALEAIRAEMEAVRAAGVVSPVNDANIAKVAARIEHQRDELGKIQAARTNTTTSQLVGLLGDDANAWIARYRNEYAGKPREGRDLVALAEICDGLHEVAHATDELARDRGVATAAMGKNLTVILNNLRVAEREYVAIRDLKRAKPPANN